MPSSERPRNLPMLRIVNWKKCMSQLTVHVDTVCACEHHPTASPPEFLEGDLAANSVATTNEFRRRTHTSVWGHLSVRGWSAEKWRDCTRESHEKHPQSLCVGRCILTNTARTERCGMLLCVLHAVSHEKHHGTTVAAPRFPSEKVAQLRYPDTPAKLANLKKDNGGK